MFTMHRRGFLQALGASAAASWFLPSIGRAESTAPRRVIFVLNELGWNPFDFRMKPRGAPDVWLERSAWHPDWLDTPDDRSWELPLAEYSRDELSPALRPLYDLREHTLALDGLALATVAADRYGDGHAKAFIAAMSGYPSRSARGVSAKSHGAVPSIDARIAAHLRAQDPNLTDLVNLSISINAWGNDPSYFHYFRWEDDGAGGTVPIGGTGDALKLAAQLFPEDGDLGPSAQARGQLAVLEHAQRRFEALGASASSADRDKLDQHATLLGDARRRIEALQALTCEAPTLASTDHINWGQRGRDPAYFQWSQQAMMQLLVASMSCGLTRVATIRLNNNHTTARFGAEDRDFHQWYSHGTDPRQRWWTPGDTRNGMNQAGHEKFLDAAPILGEKCRVNMENTAQLAEMLKAIPEGDGTMLDNTLIVFLDELSAGSHRHDQWPIVLIGGFGGAVRPGRYLRYPRVRANPGIAGMGDYIGVPNSHLLVSIAQGMGMEIDHMGIKDVGDDERIDLTGPLYGLT
ncbi:MAG: DUF1552 domain-containing protein [Myxococcota bacterium]